MERLNPPDETLTIQSGAFNVKRDVTEICYICTHLLVHGDIVHKVLDEDDLEWFAHLRCIRAAYHKVC